MARKRQARKCAAHCTDGRPCSNYAMTGTVVCSAHGGRAGRVRRAAARRVAEAEVMAAGERFAVNGGGPVDVLAELHRLVQVTSSFMEFATGRVEALSPGEWAAFGPRTAAQVDVLRAALAGARHLLTALAGLGLVAQQVEREREEWQAAQWQQMGTGLARAMTALLVEFGLPVNDEQVRSAVARHLRAARDAVA